MDELLRRWVEGWRLCRGLPPAIEYGDALAVTLGLPGRERELFALTDESAVVDRLAAGTDQGVWLTVTTQDGDKMARRLTDAGLEPFAEQQQLMSIDLDIHPRPSSAYAVEVESGTAGVRTSPRCGWRRRRSRDGGGRGWWRGHA